MLKNLDRVGDKHEVVFVKNGFGRNFLIPKGFALIANGPNLKRLEKLKAKEQAEEDKKIAEYRELATKLVGHSLKIGVKSGVSGKIFGSITNVQIASQLREELEINIERRKIILPEDIKEIGIYTAEINFHPEVQGKIEFELIKE